MNVPFYDSSREYKILKKEFDKAVCDVIESGAFILGKQVNDFEEAVCGYTGAKYAVGVANGSDALLIASDILGFKQGTEILTPVFTFFASASCIARTGGKPVLCDVDEDTFCINPEDAEKRITEKTRGIIPVHLFLQTADMSSCMELAKKYNLSVLEDAAEAFGMKTMFNNGYEHAGLTGDFGIFSFFPTKTLGGYGDGGMIVTNDEDLYRKAKSYRTHGSLKKYHHDFIGYNSRLDTLQAAILNVKLSHIEDAIKKRSENAAVYRENLKDVCEIKMPVIKANKREVYYVFCVKAEKRDALHEYLNSNGIGTSIYYPVPMHLQKCFDYLGYKEGDFPAAEKLCKTVLALPMFPELTEDEIIFVCDKIKEFYGK